MVEAVCWESIQRSKQLKVKVFSGQRTIHQSKYSLAKIFTAQSQSQSIQQLKYSEIKAIRGQTIQAASILGPKVVRYVNARHNYEVADHWFKWQGQ